MSDKKNQDNNKKHGNVIGKEEIKGGWDDFSEHHDRSNGISNTAPPPPPQKPSSDTPKNEE